MSMQTAKQFAIQQGNLLDKITMTEFFSQIHSQFYPDQDISFMEYFLELTDHDGEFYVEHTKLKEYGIMTSTRSSAVKSKLDTLGLLIDIDYTLQDVLQRGKSGAQTSKLYYLTPDGFKKCLMRAQRREGQAADPVIYCDYYLLLEKIFKLYRDYESAYDKKMISIKDDKIDNLSKKIDDQNSKIDDQSSKINELLKFGNKIIGQNDKLQLTLDMTRDELSESLDYLVDKAFHSTIDPSDNRKITHFAVLAPNNQYHEGKTIFVRGQTKRIRNVINKNRETHTPAIDMTYNANAVNLILNAQEKYELALDKYIEDFNKKVKQHNTTLAKEISKYNRDVRHAIKKGGSARPLRIFAQEKRPQLTYKEMKLYIKFNTISLWYKTNPHFSYESLIEIIKGMNEDTQKSPMASSDGSADEEESKSD